MLFEITILEDARSAIMADLSKYDHVVKTAETVLAPVKRIEDGSVRVVVGYDLEDRRFLPTADVFALRDGRGLTFRIRERRIEGATSVRVETRDATSRTVTTHPDWEDAFKEAGIAIERFGRTETLEANG